MLKLYLFNNLYPETYPNNTLTALILTIVYEKLSFNPYVMIIGMYHKYLGLNPKKCWIYKKAILIKY